MAVAALAMTASATPPWFVRTWQSDEGLPDNTVVGTAQTPDGFLWVATHTGLARFDGVQFRLFPVTLAGVMPSKSTGLLADRRGRLWLSKDNGSVVRVERGQAEIILSPRAEGALQGVRFMTEDPEGALWVSYKDGAVVRLQDGQARWFTEADGLPQEGVCQMVVDGKGQLWFSREEWVGVFREGRFKPLEQMTGLLMIAGARSGGVWGYAYKHLWKFNEDGSLVKIPMDIPLVTLTGFHEDREGFVWLGTREKGLFRCDGAGLSTVVLAQQTILTITEDREGSLWVGTRGGGLSQLRPRVAELLATGSKVPFEGVSSLCQDSGGRLWTVIWPNGELMRSEGEGFKYLSHEDGWTTRNARCVAPDAQGGVWIGTAYSGLFHWQDGVVTHSLCETNGLGGDWVCALLLDTSGALWIGTEADDPQRQVLQRWENEKLRTYNLPPGSGAVVALATDAAGDCWAATYKGLLLRVRKDVLTDETASTLDQPFPIRCLLGTPDGSLWIGYAGQGLGRLKAGRFSHCKMGQGLQDDYISNILPDKHGRLWFAGNRGIFRVNQKELDDLAEGRTERVWSVAFRRNEGLARLQASYDSWPGSLAAMDGRLLFAMQSGVAAVYADDVEENSEPPPVLIDQVTANGKPVAAYGAEGFPDVPVSCALLELGQDQKHLYLAPGQRRVEFSFTALSFLKSENIGFRYRLHPVDKEWVEAGIRRTAFFAQLQSGHYRFEVTACNNDGVWNEAGTALELTVEPYWWETAWFRVVGPLLLVGLLVGAILVWLRYRHQRQIERLEMLQATERERARIARDMHDEIGSRLSRLSMLGAMAVDELADTAAARPRVQEMTRGVREAASELEHIIWAMNPKNDTLDGLAHRICQDAEEYFAETSVQCRFKTLPEIPVVAMRPEARSAVSSAVKEALANLLKHASATVVELSMQIDEQMFQVSIVDNGIGFDSALRIAAKARGNGLSNMRERLAGMGGECRIESAPGRGTTVILCWPLEKSEQTGGSVKEENHEVTHSDR